MQFASMSLGIFDFLIEWLTNFLIWIIGFFIDLLMLLFAELFYSIGAMLLNIVDFIQLMFRKLCGLDTFYVNGVPYSGMDPLLSMMTDRDVTQVLIALTMVAVVMVIIASIIKIIQSEFSTEGSKNSKGQVFGAALKSIMLFIVVPVTCIGGVILSNMMLKVVDRATSLSDGNATMGSNIMVSACANANKVRLDEDAPLEKFGIQQSVTENNMEQIASLVDEKFRNNSYSNYNKINTMYYDTDLVGEFYVFKEMNFITLIGGALLAAYTMVMASFGMVMRLFKGAVLFMISPPMVALMPLDGGSAFKQWRTGFVKQILAAYGTIVSLNLLFIILPVVNNINLFAREDLGAGGGMSLAALNGFCHVLFTLTGLFMLKDISGLISNMIGAEDAASSGASVAGKVVGTAAKIGSVAVGGAAGLASKGLGAMASAKSKSLMKAGKVDQAKKWGAIGGALGNTGNKMFQKGKGTLAAAINKGTGMMTGGALKTSFSEEMDYDKAVAAKKEKDDKRDERFENGEATIGDWARKGLKSAPGVAFKATTASFAAMGAAKAGVDPKTAWDEGWKFGDKVATGTGKIFSAVGDGGAKIRSQALAVPAQLSAASVVTGNMLTENTKLSTALGGGTTAVFDSIKDALQHGNRGAASDQIDAILSALQGIADKTEDQKDLMQKLTTLQQQVNSSSGTKASLKRIGDDMGANLSTAMTNVGGAAQTNVSIISNTANQISADKGDVTAQLTSISDQMAQAVISKMNADRVAAGGDALKAEEEKAILDKMKREILAAQKAELEKLKGDKK